MLGHGVGRCSREAQKCSTEQQLGYNNRGPLINDHRPGSVVQIGHINYLLVDQGCRLREKPFKVSKEGRVI